MRIDPRPGEVWFADLGIAAKNRPVLVLYVAEDEDACSLMISAPLTSQIRGLRGEVDLGKPRWLPKPSAVTSKVWPVSIRDGYRVVSVSWAPLICRASKAPCAISWPCNPALPRHA